MGQAIGWLLAAYDKSGQLEINAALPVLKSTPRAGDRYLVRITIKMGIRIGSAGFSRARSGQLFFLS